MKIAVVGGAGRVGATTLFQLVLEGVADELGNTDCPGHVLFLHPDHEVPIIENLVGLKGLRGKRFRFWGLPLKVDGATGSPIRAVALVDE